MVAVRIPVFLALCACLAGAGCNKLRNTALKQVKVNDLVTVGQLYGKYYEDKGYAPQSADDLFTLARGNPQAEEALQKVRDGEYVFYWGANLKAISRTRSGFTSTVLGYEKDAPTAGGVVVMAEYTAQEMAPPVFAKAAKAGDVK